MHSAPQTHRDLMAGQYKDIGVAKGVLINP